MSIEQLIAENTMALRALTEAILNLRTVDTTPKPTAEPEPEAQKAKKTTPAKSKPTRKKPAAQKPAEEPEPEAAEAPTYEQMRAALIEFAANTERSQVVELLQKFDAATAKDLKPEQYAEVIRMCEEAK